MAKADANGTTQEDAPQAEQAEESAPADQAAPEQGPGAAEAEAEAAAPEPGSAEALSAEVDALKALLSQQKDQNLRQAAEFDNVRKRLRKDQEESLKYALEPLLRDLVGIMDNLQRAVDAARQDQSGAMEAMLAGMDMVIKQLSDTFTRYGLSAVHPKGEPFDPTRHEAVGVVETDDLPADRVVEVFQTGYLLHDRVVRPAMVNVSRPAGAGA